MNKFAKVMCMIAVVALTFTACKKKEETANSFMFHGDTEQFIVENGDGSDFEKVSIDENNRLQFEAGDEIAIFNMKSVVTESYWKIFTVQTDGSWTTTGGSMGNTDGCFYAFYPAQSVQSTTFLDNDTRVTFNLQNTQEYAVDGNGRVRIPNNSLYAAAKDETHTQINDAYFSFKNICGILSLKFYSPSGKTVTSIEVTDAMFNLVGDFTLKIDEVEPTTMTTLFRSYSDDPTYQSQLAAYLGVLGYSTNNTDNKITLSCGNGVQLGTTKAEATQFYIVMRPLALLNGCTIKVNFSNGTSKTITSTKNNMISPNVIKNIAAVSVG